MRFRATPFLATVPLAVLAFMGVAGPQPARAQEAETRRGLLDQIDWIAGPVKGSLGSVAEVGVPAACRFTDRTGAKLFMEATENPPSGREVGVLLCQAATGDSYWFVVFSYDASGLVRDDEKSSLDQAAILKTIQRGTEAGNEERRRRGWDELEVLGWQRPPYYDAVTHNLTWATRVRTKSSPDESVNHSVRILGRGGVMHADLVADPVELAAAVAAFNGVLTGYEYVPGQRYAEWRSGDKVAEYGLTALIAGGAGAAAVKLGLFGKLWKLLLGVLIALKKLVIVAILGVVALVRRLFGKLAETIRRPSPMAAPPNATSHSELGGAPSTSATDQRTESAS